MYSINNNYMNEIRRQAYNDAMKAYVARVEADPESAEGFPFSPEFADYKANMLGIGTSPLDTREKG